MLSEFPRIIWTFWQQGWQSAPETARASLTSWRRLNDGWQVNALDRESLGYLLPDFDSRESDPYQTVEALSDRVRIELLDRFGGVWADATTICAVPLDTWLPSQMQSGFFAFERPAPDRELASWFLASSKANYISQKWREATTQFWAKPRDSRPEYFWFHHLFGQLCESDTHFQRLWRETPKHPANHAFHFAPDDTRLRRPPTPQYERDLVEPSEPVFKLTHKFKSVPDQDSLNALLCRFAKGHRLGPPAKPQSNSTRRKRLLVAWYGSFSGHGTIGDLRSLESAATHLVGRGHVVSHATAADLSIGGATRVDWRAVNPIDFDGVLFVCGPILSFHPETRSLFDFFKSRPLAGVGVSLLPENHAHFVNPFDAVFARQGGPLPFGDLAIVAPLTVNRRQNLSKSRLGISLRGAQVDYGADCCLWREAEALAHLLQTNATERGDEVVTIENHLARSGVPPAEIEKQYGECDLIITTRFHGAITALRLEVPFIAIDQIRGGAKVYDLLVGLGWPHVYRIDQIDQVSLQTAARALRVNPNLELLRRTRDRAVVDANRTLIALDGWVESLVPHGLPP